MDANKGIRRRVLIVEDDRATRRLLVSILEPLFEICETSCGETVVNLVRDFRPDMVLLDIGLPGIDGYSVCRRIKHMHEAGNMQVIILTARDGASDLSLAIDQGADDYIVKPIDSTSLRARLQLHCGLIDARHAAQQYAAELTEKSTFVSEILEARRKEQQAIQDAAIFTLAKVAESRDHETGNHLIRISEYSGTLAAALVEHPDPAYRLTIQESLALPRLSTLHDIGKVGIPDSILLKPGKLDAEEWRIMESHTIIGWEILEEAVKHFPSANFLRGGAVVAKYHHERWDGTGYPCGLKGSEIPLLARIVSIADVFDALTSDRPYRDAWTPERARDLITQGSGTHFDPFLVTVFQSLFQEFCRIQNVFAESTTPVFQYVLQAQSKIPMAAASMFQPTLL